MRALSSFLGAISLLIGLSGLIYAWYMPSQFGLSTASAVQVTEVYTLALHSALIGIGFMLGAVVFALSALRSQLDDNSQKRESSMPNNS